MANHADMHQVALVNECVKEVIKISSKIYLIALNAMFMARQTDGQAKAFSSVTTELRAFSDRLEKHMRVLSSDVHELLITVAQEASISRDTRILLKTRDEMKVNRHIHYVDQVVRNEEHHDKEMLERMGAKKYRVKISLEKAARICTIGENLSVLAKMESVGAGSASNSLRQVAEHIDETVTKIHDVLRQAKSVLDGGIASIKEADSQETLVETIVADDEQEGKAA